MALLCGCGKSKTHHVKFDYTFAEQTFPIHFIWNETDGDIHVSKPEAEENREDAWRWSVSGNAEIVKIYLYLEPYNMGYLILYDVYKDMILDVLAGVPNEQKMAINDVYLAEDLTSAMLLNHLLDEFSQQQYF